jgi:hypothetical protein
MLISRVGAHYKEIIAGAQAAVAGAGREQRYIACAHGDFVTPFAAQHQAGRSAGKSENLVRRRVVVMIEINAVAPLWGPPVAGEQCFTGRCRVVA